jgi:hypothetical protein
VVLPLRDGVPSLCGFLGADFDCYASFHSHFLFSSPFQKQGMYEFTVYEIPIFVFSCV